MQVPRLLSKERQGQKREADDLFAKLRASEVYELIGALT